jgi:hypothetical protein
MKATSDESESSPRLLVGQVFTKLYIAAALHTHHQAVWRLASAGQLAF